MVKVGAGVPVPLKVAVCGEPAALSATESVAEKVATDAGVKVIWIRQFAPAASVVPQALLPVAMAKSAALVPVTVMPVILSVALPELVSVALCAALVAPTVAVKLSGEADDKEATGAADEAMPKLAVTLSGALMVTVVEALFAAATLPVQFVNEKPVFGVAVRLTTVPGA